jgi:hypothetical protein
MTMTRYLGMTDFGAIDIGATARDLRAMGPLTVGQARVLLVAGEKMIEAAIASAGSLPGDGKRQECLWKLRWHSDELAKLSDGNAHYGADADLKKWVGQAAVELNATEEGKRYQQAVWTQMVDEIKARAAAVVTAPLNFLAKVASVPWWAWAGGATVVGGGLLWFALRRRR